MDALEKSGNTTGLYYYYGLIIRNLFFFDMPEAAGLVGNPREDSILYESMEQKDKREYV